MVCFIWVLFLVLFFKMGRNCRFKLVDLSLVVYVCILRVCWWMLIVWGLYFYFCCDSYVLIYFLLFVLSIFIIYIFLVELMWFWIVEGIFVRFMMFLIFWVIVCDMCLMLLFMILLIGDSMFCGWIKIWEVLKMMVGKVLFNFSWMWEKSLRCGCDWFLGLFRLSS